jgi:hypothetical protein
MSSSNHFSVPDTGYKQFHMSSGHPVVMMNTSSTIHSKLLALRTAKMEDTTLIKNIPRVPKWKIITDEQSANENQNDTWDGILKEDALSVSGDRKMSRLEFVLSNLPQLTRHEYQRMFHREMEMAMLPRIYDAEWESNSNSILMKYNQTVHRAEKLIVCPRRFGKTASVVMFVTAVLYVIPNITIEIPKLF